jgi:hypothetical protein
VLLPKGAPFDDEEPREHRDVNGGWLEGRELADPAELDA